MHAGHALVKVWFIFIVGIREDNVSISLINSLDYVYAYAC